MERIYFKVLRLLSKEYIKEYDYEGHSIKYTEVIHMIIVEVIPSIYIKELIDSMPDIVIINK